MTDSCPAEDPGAPNRLLLTDDLHELKEGAIYVDPETGKRFRVRKTILPGRASQGPHGIGDPDDRSLRKIEADVIIPNRMNAHIEKVECNPMYMKLIECFRSDGAARGLYSCKGVLEEFNRCKADHFNSMEFRQHITNEYIAERSETRRTGMTEKQRNLEEYRAWKKTQE